MYDFHPNKLEVQMSSFLTVMNEAHIALGQWQKEKQVKVSKGAGMSHDHLRCWA